jgi:membrane fusion protein, multidrug efflux system
VIRRHYFLIVAVAAIVLMIGFVGFKLVAGGESSGPGGGGGGAVAAGPGGGAGAGGGAGGAGGAARRPGGPGGGRGAPMMEVTTVPVNLQSFADRIEVLGVAKGRQSVTITSKNSELITAVRFRDGDRVRTGQVLVDLQGTEQDAAIDQAQSVADLAKLNADRWTTLEQRGIAAKSQADQYRAVYQQAQASLAAAKARRQDRVIRAPFSGVVGLTEVAPGALISPGAVIATLDDVDVIRVDFDVPDRYLSVIRAGTPIVATADSYPSEIFSGQIGILDSRINERTRTIKARALLNNSAGRLKPGMLMRIGIQEGMRQALVAPEAAVQFDDTQAYVFVVSEREGQAISTKRPVVIGSRDRGFIEIKTGLQPGDLLVADGINRLQQVTPVRVVKGERPGGAVAAGQAPRPSGAGGAAAPKGGARREPV